MTFQRYQFKELVPTEQKQPNAAFLERDEETYQETNFSVAPEQTVTKTTEQKVNNFRLDKNVASQLGIEEKERKSFEAKIQKEIDKRWLQTREKAEVEGYTKGLEEGKKEAYAAELPRIQERLAKLDHILQEFDNNKQKIFAANESFLMQIISQVARMVVLKEVAIDKEYIHRVVIALLNQLGTKEDIKIFLSESDFANMESLRASVEKEFGKLSNTSIEVSQEIPAGGCKIETRFGVVDASVQTQIENITKALQA